MSTAKKFWVSASSRKDAGQETNPRVDDKLAIQGLYKGVDGKQKIQDLRKAFYEKTLARPALLD